MFRDLTKVFMDLFSLFYVEVFKGIRVHLCVMTHYI